MLPSAVLHTLLERITLVLGGGTGGGGMNNYNSCQEAGHSWALGERTKRHQALRLTFMELTPLAEREPQGAWVTTGSEEVLRGRAAEWEWSMKGPGITTIKSELPSHSL